MSPRESSANHRRYAPFALAAAGLPVFAERVRPAVRTPPEAAAQELEALLARRRQLLEMLQAERNRLGQVFGRGKQPVKKSLKGHIAFLERELRITDTPRGFAPDVFATGEVSECRA